MTEQTSREVVAVPGEHVPAGAIDMDQLVREEYARIRGLAWRLGVPAHELDDTAQEVMARAWKASGRFRGECTVRTWLTRIAVNYVTSWRRRLLRRMRLFVRDARVDDVPARSGPSPETAEAHERAMECIERLPVKLRNAFVLRHLEDMSHAEAAEALEIPEATCRTRIYHARKRLRQMMQDFEP